VIASPVSASRLPKSFDDGWSGNSPRRWQLRQADDPGLISPEARRQEIAAIFAAGIRRLHSRSAIHGEVASVEISPESETACLEVSPESVLSVTQRG